MQGIANWRISMRWRQLLPILKKQKSLPKKNETKTDEAANNKFLNS